jgi:hypothetical protein
MPGHFRTFATASGDARWTSARSAVLDTTDALQLALGPTTGLVPDFAIGDGLGGWTAAPPNFLEGPEDGDYSYNSCRVPWRLGSDAVLSGDPAAVAQLQAINAWLVVQTGGNGNLIEPGYELDGTPIWAHPWFTAVFAGPFGVAAMFGGDQAWLDDIYTPVANAREGYFEDSVGLFSLLVMSGNWWEPV